MSRVLLQLSTVAIGAGFVASAAQAAAGRIPGSFNVSDTGSATYTIPVEVPPGARGLQPRLSINYNSTAGTGTLGVGWYVAGLSSITRCNHTFAQDAGAPASVALTTADAFCLDGQRLRITSAGGLPTYGQDGTTYQTELANFSNVTAHVTTPANGPDYFTVQGKDGLIYEYGNGGTTNARVVATNTTIATAWLLNKVIDRKNNNSMVITYLAPSATLSGTTIPSTISWAPVSAAASTYSYALTYHYSPTSEVLTAAYVAGTPILNQDLLTDITIANSAGTTIRKYAFSYTASSTTGRSTLTQVRECADSAESNCLRATNIAYQQGTPGLSATPVSLTTTASLPVTRFDFNADGFDDLLTTNGGSTYIAFGSAGGYGASSAAGIPTPVAEGDIWGVGRDSVIANNGGTLYAYTWDDASGAFQGVSTGVVAPAALNNIHLVDVNGDGKADLVVATNRSSTSLGVTTYSLDITTYLNTGSGSTLSFGAPNAVGQHSCQNCNITAFGPSSSVTGRLKTWDFDGDGRGDLLMWVQQIVGTTIHDNLYRLQANGVNFTPVTEALTTGGSPPGAPTVVNWNNDACSDISWLGFRISGCGGSSATAIAVPGTPVVAMDWNGDGRMDLVVGNGSTLGVYLSTGTGLSSLQTTSIPYSSNCLYWAADIDGDGQDDLLCWNVGGSANTVSYYLHNSPGLAPDLVTSITDGYDINFSPTYVSTARGSYSKGSSPSYPEQYVAAPFNIVSQVAASDGVGGTYTRTFSYSGARADARGRGFEGLLSKTSSDSRAASLVATRSFQTAFPFTGMLSSSVTYQHDGTTKVEEATYTDIRNDLSTVAGNERTFAYPQTIVTQRYEVGSSKNGLPITTTTVSNTLDNYGNATHVSTTVKDVDAGSPYFNQQWSTTRDVTISPSDGSNWCLSLPTQVLVTNAAPGVANIVRTQAFTPDYVLCHQTQQVTEPSSGTYAVTQAYVYDDFDNVKTVTTTGAGMAARVSSTDWGTTGQFPMTATNALSQLTTFHYDLNVGKMDSVLDPNGVSRSWHYDPFGRRDRENRADGTFTTWSYDDCAALTEGCAIGSHALAILETQYDSTSTFLTNGRTWFDQLDRPLISIKRQLSGAYDRNEVQYDNLGRVSQAYMPCTWSALTTHCSYATTNAYDALGRLTQSSRPRSATDATSQSTLIVYAGRTTTTTDAEGKISTQIATVAGTVGRIQDHDGYAQNFTYDAFGSLLGVADSGGNTLFSAAYDYGIGPFQRDATDADLDVSTVSGQHRHFNYDALGELTSWSDAKGQSFSQTYDALSRPLVRAEPDLTTAWTWDFNSGHTRQFIGKLIDVSAASSSGTYAEAYTYDGIGRLSNRAFTIPADGGYSYDYAYSAVTGLLDTLTYPVSTASHRLKLQYGYQNGVLQSVSDFDTPSTVYWAANAANARGQVTQETLGNGVVTTRAFDDVTGWMSTVQSGTAGGWQYQNDQYLFDRVGNVTQRQNNNATLTESFLYDNVYRLQSSTLQGSPNLALTYYANGNVKTRSDVASGATWTYDASRVHAVTQAGSSAYTYSYDANGNAQSRDGLTVNWTSYNHPSLINGINQYDGSVESVSFAYDQNHLRWRAVYSGSTGLETTYMIGDLMEKVVTVGAADYRHYIYANGTKIAVYSRTDAGVNTTHYLREDNQGGIAAILTYNDSTHEIDALKESFTAFGNRRSTCTWSGNPTAGNIAQTNSVTRHGYTWQTALGAMGLNDMNGRIQDAITGRFLSPDPYVSDPSMTQGYNRYSYVNNNPMSFTDPTGFAQAPKNLRPRDGAFDAEVPYTSDGGTDPDGTQYVDLTGHRPHDELTQIPDFSSWDSAFDPDGLAAQLDQLASMRIRRPFWMDAVHPYTPPPRKQVTVQATQQNPQEIKSCWAAGINFEFSTINPVTSGGGGSYGVNLEWTAGHGLAIYTYGTPQNTSSQGFLIGPSVSLNAAKGKGGWTGLFDSVAGSYGPATGGAFWSTPGADDPGYFGVNLGFGKGPPGIGATTTNYTERARLTHPAPNNCTEPQ